MKTLAVTLGLLLLNNLALGVEPQILEVSDQRVSQGGVYSFKPSLVQQEPVYWVKTYGPDEVTVNPIQGTVKWVIPANLPSESFHIGVKAINSDGEDEETWIVTVGDGKVLYIGPDEAVKTLKDGLAAINPGDTLVMRNGRWDHGGGTNTIPGASQKSQYLKGGDEGKYTTLMAEDPGKVIIDGNNEVPVLSVFGSDPHPDWGGSGSSFSGNTSYTAFKGLVLVNSSKESLLVEYSHHVKLINIGVGPSAINDWRIPNVYINKTQYVLIEGMYSWGHGRYKIQYKYSSEGVVRRSVIRIDNYNGYLDSGQYAEPLGGYISYCSKNIIFQNNIMIDSDQSNYWSKHYELTNAFGVAATNCYDYPSGIVFKRSLSLNTHMGLMKADVRNTTEPVIWKNIVGWDMKPFRQLDGTGGAVPLLSGVAVTESNNITMGDVLLDGGSGSDFYFYTRDQDKVLTSKLQNSVLYRLGWNGSYIEDRGDLVRNTGSTGFQFINNNIFGFEGELVQIGNVTESGTTYIDPQYEYITMLPRDSDLRRMSSNNGRVGAEVMTMIGRSGTHYGDNGYDAETNLPMWPFPNQDIAHEYMGAFRWNGVDRNGNSPGITGARGFAVSGQTLSDYIWGYLGNAVPPFNISAVSGKQQVKLMWEPPSVVAANDIDHFNIYQVNGASKVLLGIAGVDQFSYTISGLENDKAYQFAVVSVKSDGSIGDYSYAVDGYPIELARPKPPALSIN